MVRICVDAVGGDEGSAPVLEGVEQALRDSAAIEILLAGPAKVVESFAASHDRVTPLVASEIIAMDEHPAAAVRKKQQSSIVMGCKAVGAGDADAFFSAGSTGAILGAATLYVKRVKGVIRPAIAAVLPSVGRHSVFLDLGANADCKPAMLVQFAQMGSFYARMLVQEAFGEDGPTVALLANGVEDTKGSDQSQAFFSALSRADSHGAIHFVGNCEGNDLLAGTYDVIVADGFTGNVALKSMEATAKYIVGVLKKAAGVNVSNALGALMLKKQFTHIGLELSGTLHGGAILLGLQAPVFIGHGHTSPMAVSNGILAAARAWESDICGKIAGAFQG